MLGPDHMFYLLKEILHNLTDSLLLLVYFGLTILTVLAV